MIGRLCDRLGKHPQLLHLISQPKTLKILLSSLAVLDTSLACAVTQILISVCTHPSHMPTDLLNVSCEEIWPEIQRRVNSTSSFTRYLLNLATYVSSKEKSNLIT